MIIQNLQYIYKIAPALDAIESSNIEGRWFSEKRKNYIYTLLSEYDHFVGAPYIDECKDLIGFTQKIPETIIAEIRIKSPKIVFEFVECKDINLESITNKLKEAATLALEYHQFDISIDINMLLKKIKN